MTIPALPQTKLNDCGCCEGVAVETPREIDNRPGLSAIAYRAGTQTRFKASMIAGLSESGLAELRKLRTRDDDDFTIALLDAWALVCDVLAFYQERIANESYLLTATERASIINLARLIGYQLRPGVAAGTYLAFTLETGAGSPALVTIGERTKVQSIPGPDEKPQTFETVEGIESMGEWNAMKPRLTRLIAPEAEDKSLYLQGTTLGLKVGDAILLVGDERVESPASENWDFRLIEAVAADESNSETLISWERGLGWKSANKVVEPAKRNVKVHAFRRRAAVFGYNAPDWRLLPDVSKAGYLKISDPSTLTADQRSEWPEFTIFPPGATANEKTIDLDAVYPKIVKDSWLVLSIPKYDELYQVAEVSESSRAQFSLTSKTSRVKLEGNNLETFENEVRSTTVFTESEELQLGETPIDKALTGNEIELDRLITPLPAGRSIVITGRRARARIKKAATGLSLISADDPQETVALDPGDELIITAPWEDLVDSPGVRRWYLLHESGLEGYVNDPEEKIKAIAADEKDPLISEVATIKLTDRADDTHSRLILETPLSNVFDRTSVAINANVALATHGETIAGEVLGSGDGGQSYQRFALRESPLTYTSADTPSGGETTLEVRVNDLKWSEVATLFGHGPRERIFITHTNDDQSTAVQFGDGLTGARLPMGHENVKATYRKGIGLEGLVKASQLSLLMTRPLGVKSVVNPLPAAGAQGPQSLADARTNSPITVLTLDRIVSLTDYEDFARSFSGIAKALATWTWNLHARGVFVTVAGIDGAAVEDELHDTLVAAILKYGDTYIPITVKSYRAVRFKLIADIKVDPDYIQEKVLAGVEAELRSRFSFAARGFGQSVALSEVMSAMQNVAGVVAVDVNQLYRNDQNEAWNEFLSAEAPRAGDDASVPAAELLTLDPAPLELGVMP